MLSCPLFRIATCEECSDKRLHASQSRMPAACRMFRVAVLVLSGVSATAVCRAENADDLFRVVKAADVARRTDLRSGEGKGTYRIYDGLGAMIEDAEVHARFDNGKFNIELIYRLTEKGKRQYDRRVLVTDKSALFVARFSNRIRPVGCEVDVVPLSLPSIHSSTEGLSFDLSDISRSLIDPRIFEKERIRMEKVSDARYRGHLKVTADYSAIFEFAADVGFNAVSCEGRQKDGTVDSKTTAEWKKDSGVWYVTKAVSHIYRERALFRRCELVYREFKVNPKLSPALFTMDGLGMPERTRLIDRRPDAHTKLYNTRPVGRTDQTQLEDMVHELEKLPPRSVEGGVLDSRWRMRPVIAILTSVLGLIVVFVVWLARRKEMRRGDSRDK